VATARLYENDADRQQHYRAIQMLAMDSGVAEEEIQALYETILGSFKEKARIKDFLVILVSRNVRDLVKRA
jgi:hypothetical protein